jgi:hypothetical protein
MGARELVPTPPHPPKRHQRSFFSSFFSDKQKWRLLGSLNVSTPLLTPSSLSSCLSISLYLRWWWWYSFLADTPPSFPFPPPSLPTSDVRNSSPPLPTLFTIVSEKCLVDPLDYFLANCNPPPLLNPLLNPHPERRYHDTDRQ